MSNIEQKTVEILNKLDTIATQYTPEVIDAATTAVSVTAIGNLIWGVVGLASAYLAWKIGIAYVKYAKVHMNDWENGPTLGVLLVELGLGIVTLTTIGNLLDIWNWVAIWNPKLALAHQVLGL